MSRYAMGPKGLLLILTCSDKPAVAAADAKALRDFFNKEKLNIDFGDPLERRCTTVADLENQMQKAKEMLQTNTDIRCFICAILGNGHQGFIDLAEGEYKIENIRRTFRNDEKAPYFTGRPKVFLIQASQGQNLQEASYKFTDSEIAVHVDADALVAYANTPGYVAFENDKGSYFIQTCIKVFESKYQSCHLEEMMTIVKEEMSCYRFRPKKPLEQKQADDETFTQIPCVWTTLTRFLYFKAPH